jgi:uncharacterized lipoprotein
MTLQSCAFIKENIDVAYCPRNVCTTIDKAKQYNIAVTVVDRRTRKDKVSYKKGGWGEELAPIMVTNDVADLLQQAIKDELIGRGFNICEGQKNLEVDLMKFDSDFKTGFYLSSAEAEAILNVQITNQDNKLFYGSTIIGHGGNNWLYLHSGKNAKIALDTALQDAIYQLLGDQCFINALMQ